MSSEWELLWQKGAYSEFEADEKYFYTSEDLV